MHIETRSHVEKKLLEYILLLRIISIPNPNALKTFIQQEYNLPIKFYNAILLLKRAVSQHRDDVIYLGVIPKYLDLQDPSNGGISGWVSRPDFWA